MVIALSSHNAGEKSPASGYEQAAPGKEVVSLVLNDFLNDTRVLKTALSLQAAGYGVRVLALHEKGLPEEECIRGVTVQRIRLATRGWPKFLFSQALKYLELAVKVIRRCRRVGIIHCNDLGPLPIAVMIKLLSAGKIKIVYDTHELQTERHGMRGLRKAAARLAERILIRRVDKVITVSGGIAREYARRYGIPGPELVLNCPPYRPAGKENRFRERFRIDSSRVIFLYQGRLDRGRGLEQLLEAFKGISGGKAALVLMGFGPFEERARREAEQNANIHFNEAVSPEELLNYTASADVGIVVYEASCLNHAYALPNKLFEYVMAGLPVLAGNLPEMKDFIEKNRCGFILEELSPGVISDVVEKIAAADLAELSANARAASRTYNWETQEQVLKKVYRTLA